MTESLRLGGSSEGSKIRRLNRVPIILVIALVVIFFAVIFYGLSSRGLRFGDGQIEPSSAQPASNDAERLKQGVPDGIIGEPQPAVDLQPVPAAEPEPARNPFERNEEEAAAPPPAPALEPEEVWRARLQREFDEQMLREYNRQQMASIQADEAAANSPIAINLQGLESGSDTTPAAVPPPGTTINRGTSALDLYSAALQAGIGQQNADPNGQAAKREFFNQDIADLGYLP
ncbi:MAG: conjugal transfer protein TrbI, partial [Maritimibacter sp.]|nr:conjugal transfer protein TrbI [Maritimibacter sp.]